MKHETLIAERLAMGWHCAGIFVSLMSAMFSVAVSVLIEPLAAMRGEIGALFYMVYLTCVTNVFLCAGGVLWHLFASREHRKQIVRLESK